MSKSALVLILFALMAQFHLGTMTDPTDALLNPSSHQVLAQELCRMVFRVNYWLRCKENYGTTVNLTQTYLTYAQSAQNTLTEAYQDALEYQYPEDTNTRLKDYVLENYADTLSFIQMSSKKSQTRKRNSMVKMVAFSTDEDLSSETSIFEYGETTATTTEEEEQTANTTETFNSCNRLSELNDTNIYDSAFIMDWQYLQDEFTECLALTETNNGLFNCIYDASSQANTTVAIFNPSLITWRQFREFQYEVNQEIITRYICVEDLDWPEDETF